MDNRGMTATEWLEVEEAMETIAPYYEKVNYLMTFGMVDRWRHEVAALAKPDETVLEIGSGPGLFTRLLDSQQVYCLEPSRDLAIRSRSELDGNRVTLLRGVGEEIPLAESSVDRVFCVFSFRDFFDRERGAAEMLRVLREGGEAHIVDIAKHEQGPFSKLMDVHVKYMVPVLARVAAGPWKGDVWQRDPYRTFGKTFHAFGTAQVHEDILRRAGFAEVCTEFLALKGAAMTRGKKPWKSTS
jgi:demethylmenaquinone methyltransferase/2-methoxy-6-polyprenyl-1,4-benzoquinol methylase